MAAGQLAGGLAWLAISGEDAPDLVATAPILRSHIVRAKIEAVLGGIAIAFTPFLVALAFLSVYAAFVSALGILMAAVAATGIQFWFRKQATRRYFRHRQTASRFATFAEAFLVDLMGGSRRARGRRHALRAVPRRDRPRHSRRRALDEPVQIITKAPPP
jgi:hypothetical protein